MSRQRETGSFDTLGAAASFLRDQGMQVKTEEDLRELIEACIFSNLASYQS